MNALETDNPIDCINRWYQSKCDGHWEHEFGVEIKTIDNPGWVIKLTGENSKVPVSLEIERSDDDWIHATSSASTFTGHCGSPNFNELLLHAAKWLQSGR